MNQVAESDALHARVRAFVHAADDAREPFEALALALARYQAAHVPAFARLVAARGVDLDRAASADAIPAVPCDAFRFARIAAHSPSDDARVFRTSGTTVGAATRGAHAFRTLATYDAAAVTFGRAMLWPDGLPKRAIALTPPPDEAPDSSLGYMIERFARELGGPASWHLGAGRLDVRGLARAIEDARVAGDATLVMGTSFAFVHLLDAIGADLASLELPEGSRIMQTGGFKGRSRAVEPEPLRAAIAHAFGVPSERVVSEYGMTELSSQLYEDGLAASLRGEPPCPGYVAPPWVRVTAVDPVSFEPIAAGAVGLARIVDLANVDSAVVVQTADRIRLRGGAVELLGRAEGAPPRGCSLAIEQMLGAPPDEGVG